MVHPTYRDARPGAAAGAAPVETALEKAVEIKSGYRPRLVWHRREGCSLSPGPCSPSSTPTNPHPRGSPGMPIPQTLTLQVWDRQLTGTEPYT